VGPPQYPACCQSTQDPQRRFRRRRCLLKGCERSFRPSQPQGRYCSSACQEAARRWRYWHARKQYQSTEQGKARRRAQSRRYRERRRQQAAAVPVGVNGVSTPVAALPAEVDVVGAAVVAPPREGQRPAMNFPEFIWRPCRRPGCYELFPVQPRSPGQQFCSCSCRKALRRVLDREAHWQRRHRHRRPQRQRRSGSPPNTS
jgi:hypothetical protein